jgi:hypothetical protein
MAKLKKDEEKYTTHFVPLRLANPRTILKFFCSKDDSRNFLNFDASHKGCFVHKFRVVGTKQNVFCKEIRSIKYEQEFGDRNKIGGCH